MNDIVFDKFDSIKSLGLRVFNRVVYLNNLYQQAGKEISKEYISQFDNYERFQMFVMGKHILDKGVDQVRREVTEGVIFEDDIQIESSEK